jgi:predicted ATPase/DNA-binding XRE family transcriptional regulator
MRNDAEPAGDSRSPFRSLLRELRIAANLSQETLAELAGVSVSGISALERGTRTAPHRDTVALLAAALDASAAERVRLDAAALRASGPRRREPQTRDAERRINHNLPLSLTTFFGRDEEVQAVAKALTEHRLVALTGTGGIGKTRLALETAHTVGKHFSDGVWYVELAPLADPGLVAQRIAMTLGGTARHSDAGRSTAWITQLLDKQLLIVLDNCEHLLEASAVVTQQILERCPAIRILATSREALRIGGEYVVRVNPLPVPQARGGQVPAHSDLRGSPAIRLFLDRARHVAPTLKFPDEAGTWQELGSICARLDGMPLAIELAATRMTTMSLSMLSRGLAARFQLLTNGTRTALPRHQTLSALIDWSYDLLSAVEQRTLRRLAVFSGGWTLESALAVCADDDLGETGLLGVLSSLVEKSLVFVDAGTAANARYGMLETARAYALDRLRTEGEREPTARRHLDYFWDLIRRSNASWGDVPLVAWVASLQPELDNFRTALQWAVVERNDVELGAMLAVAQQTVLESSSLDQEGWRWCELALETLGPNPAPALEAPLQLALANYYMRDARYQRCLDAALRSATLYETVTRPSTRRKLSARGCRATALAIASHALTALHRYDEAARVGSEAFAVARRESETMVLIWALQSSANGADSATRRTALAEALALSRDFPPGYYFEGVTLLCLGITEFMRTISASLDVTLPRPPKALSRRNCILLTFAGRLASKQCSRLLPATSTERWPLRRMRFRASAAAGSTSC